jgi:hypothetical protein
MNILSREKQIEVVAALCEGVGIRIAARVNRGTVGSLALRVGLGCMELHDRLMVGIRTERCELDEAWSFVAKKQKNVLRHGFHPYRVAIRDAFGDSASHGVIVKTYSVTHLAGSRD